MNPSIGFDSCILIVFAKKLDKKSGYSFELKPLFKPIPLWETCDDSSFKSTIYVPDNAKTIAL